MNDNQAMQAYRNYAAAHPQGVSPMRVAEFAAQSPAAMRRAALDMEAARRGNVRNGNLEKVTGTVAFQTDAGGVIAAGTFRQMFVDQLGQGVASGFAASALIQTRADGNFHGGKVPAGQMFVFFAQGFQAAAQDGQITAADIDIIARNVSVRWDLRGTQVYAAGLQDWPTLVGPRGVGNGNGTNGYSNFAPPIVCAPLVDLSVTLTVERAITLAQANATYFLHGNFPAVRIYDPENLARS